jgi:hypothetical protein
MIRPAPELSWPPVAGELAVYDARDGRYHILNSSAAAIWVAIASETPVEQVAAELAGAHGVPIDAMRADIDAFVADARQLGLLVDG